MTEKQITRYLDLSVRMLELLLSGINWKPEYETELEAIKKELYESRPLIDAEHEKKERERHDT